MRKIAFLTALLLFSSAFIFVEGQITGTVTDSKDGSPLSAISVKIKGTNIGTSTKADGTFSLDVSQSQVTLEFSGVGFLSTQQKVSNKSTVNVKLDQDTKSLNEVVVTALGTKRNKNDVVYGNQTVRNDELNDVTNRSAINALQGKVAGVKITSASGAPGSSTRIVIRGETSLGQGNNALIVVDGVPITNGSSSGGGGTGTNGDRDNYVDFGNRANDINPDDIESETVLSGPAATTLYGSRGSAGVVLITTKRGQKEKNGHPKITVGSSYSVEKAILVIKRQDEFGSGYTSCGYCGGPIDYFSGENFSWGPKFDGHMVPWTAIPVTEDANGNLIPLPLSNGKIEQLVHPYSAVPNQLQNFFDNGSTIRNNVSINGGDDKYTYYLSYTNFNNNGIIPHTFYDKNNFLFNGEAKFSDKITASTSINYTKTDQRGNIEGAYPFGSTTSSPAYGMALQTPVGISFNDLRDYNSPYNDFKGFYGEFTVNPYFILDQQKIENTVDNVIGSLTVNYTPVKPLTITGRISTNFYTTIVDEQDPQYRYAHSEFSSDGGYTDESFDRSGNNYSLGAYSRSLSRVVNLNYDAYATYATNLSKNIKLTAIAGANATETNTNFVSGQTQGGLVIPGFYDLSNSQSLASGVDQTTIRRLIGYYLNASAGYKNYLFLEYSAREDVSSTLPVTDNSFFYQAGGFSFVPTNIFKFNKGILSYLKIRGDVGSSGKDAPLYDLQSTFAFSPVVLNASALEQIYAPFNGQPGTVKSSQLGNPNLKPELTNTYEGGADIGFFDDRLSIAYTYYNSNSKNQIVPVNLPWSSGYAFYPLNIGRMTNKGHELTVRGTPIRNSVIKWDLFMTYSQNTNEVVSIADAYGLSELAIFQGLISFAGHGNLDLVAKEGLPFGTYKATGFVYDKSGHVVVNAAGTPLQNSTDSYLGSYQPKYQASFGTDFAVKGVKLHVLFDARVGGYFYSSTQLNTEFNGTASTTTINDRQPFVVDNSVVQNGVDANNNPVYVTNTTKTNAYQYLQNVPASHYLVDATYLKLRDVSLDYTIPASFLRKTPIADLTIGLFAKNLKFWVAKGNTFADPEVGGVGGASDAVGIETGTTPTSRSLGIDLKLTLK